MTKASKARRCPVCGKPQDPSFKPFCSLKCADIDLYRWLGGKYRIETEEEAPKGAPTGKPGEA